MFTITLLAFFVTFAIAAFLYFRPRFAAEGFTTIAIDPVSAPKCFLRDAEAQELIGLFGAVRAEPPASEKAMALAELTLIVQKLLCIDADVTGMGMGPYSTFALPYATAHDIEPVANFVGRCIRNAVRSNDVEQLIQKLEGRGNELLEVLVAKDAAVAALAKQKFRSIVLRSSRNIADACLRAKASMDVPAGPRDPGYYEPAAVQQLRPYRISGDGAQYL